MHPSTSLFVHANARLHRGLSAAAVRQMQSLCVAIPRYGWEDLIFLIPYGLIVVCEN